MTRTHFSLSRSRSLYTTTRTGRLLITEQSLTTSLNNASRQFLSVTAAAVVPFWRRRHLLFYILTFGVHFVQIVPLSLL